MPAASLRCSYAEASRQVPLAENPNSQMSIVKYQLLIVNQSLISDFLICKIFHQSPHLVDLTRPNLTRTSHLIPFIPSDPIISHESPYSLPITNLSLGLWILFGI